MSYTPLLPYNISMPARKPAPPVYILKVTLDGIEPPIWRRIVVPASIKLCCLHSTLQVVMGWTGSHLHQFKKGGQIRGDATHLSELLTAEGQAIHYLYDFGDNWSHQILLEQILPPNPDLKTPLCINGQRHCPPEDVGGVPGYQQFLEVIFDPTHIDFPHIVRWAGGPFHAEDFDIKTVNASLSRMRLPIRHRR